MVALRKDVKFGLTIGAIAVSVIGVYAGLSALATDKPAAGNAARLDTAAPVGGARKPDASGASVASRTPAKPEVARPSTNTTPIVTAPPTTPGNTGVSAAPPSPAAATDDPWAAAFGSGRVPPAVTVTPDPAKPTATASTPGRTTAGPSTPGQSTAADRSETIKAINGSGPTTPGSQQTQQTTADASGAMNSTPGSAVLTRVADAAAPAAADARTHTVLPGETFSGIASEYYGDAKYFAAIIAANPDVNPNRLKPGTVIKIPALAKRDAASDTVDLPANGTAAAAIDATKQYVVKPGDSLHKIAGTLWGDSAMSGQLYELNKGLIGTDPAKLKLGMVLALPTPPRK